MKYLIDLKNKQRHWVKPQKLRHNSLDSLALANYHRHALVWWGRREGCEWAWACANPIVQASISSQTCACTVVRRSASSKIKLNFRGNFLSSRVVLYSFSCCKANKVVGSGSCVFPRHYLTHRTHHFHTLTPALASPIHPALPTFFRGLAPLWDEKKERTPPLLSVPQEPLIVN